MMFVERIGFIIWVSDLKVVCNLEKYGIVYYIFCCMYYVVMYVNVEWVEDMMKNVKWLFYVCKIERFYCNEIKIEYVSKMMDKISFYGI